MRFGLEPGAPRERQQQAADEVLAAVRSVYREAAESRS
jgi:hypothetical protein